MIELESNDKQYPQRLKVLKKPPKLYVLGNIELLSKDSIAIIGSRKSSTYGEKIANKFSSDLTQKGLSIVSGLAIGIDAIAHYSCIGNGGKTIAVLGSGFNYIYPKENEKLFNLILKSGGTIITEYPPDTKVKKSNFPTRNRIVSALALGVVVIEASYRSGTSITAHNAMKQGRPVFCVPNSIGSKNSTGTINLLLEGAKLIKNVDNIIEQIPELNNRIPNITYNELQNKLSIQGKQTLNIFKRNIQLSDLKENSCAKSINVKKSNRPNIIKKFDSNNLNEEQIKIVECIQKNVIIDANKISEITNISIQKVNCNLTILEIKGIIKPNGGNTFKYIAN